MRIEYVAFNKNPQLFMLDPSYIYRCQNISIALGEEGFSASLSHLKNIRVKQRRDVMVLHRPRYSLRLLYVVKQMLKLKSKVIVDVDDLVFDVDFVRHSPAVLNGVLSERKVKKVFAKTKKSLSMADHITVSTSALAKRVCSLFPGIPVTVIYNSVYYGWLGSNLPIIEPRKRNKVITYTPGTRSHNCDFLQIRSAIEHFLSKYADVKLRITGPLDVKITAREGQVEYNSKKAFSEHAETVRTGWVNLMPLEQTPFNECKSALKVIEAGYWGIPTICSPNPDAERFVSAGAIIARNEGEWFDVLERMLNEDEYVKITTELREKTLALADINQQAKMFIKEVLGEECCR